MAFEEFGAGTEALTLDKKALGALSSEKRIAILKLLRDKKMILSDISMQLNLQKSTVHEHLNRLVESGLVNRIEREGYKWVFYEITQKGLKILTNEGRKVILLLSSSVLSFVGGGLLLWRWFTPSTVAGPVMKTLTAGVAEEAAREESAQALAVSGAPVIAQVVSNPWFLGVSIGAFVLGIGLFILGLKIRARLIVRKGYKGQNETGRNYLEDYKKK